MDKFRDMPMGQKLQPADDDPTILAVDLDGSTVPPDAGSVEPLGSRANSLRPASPADADLYASGTQFLTPDGRLKVNP
jgi:hypothetical protein